MSAMPLRRPMPGALNPASLGGVLASLAAGLRPGPAFPEAAPPGVGPRGSVLWGALQGASMPGPMPGPVSGPMPGPMPRPDSGSRSASPAAGGLAPPPSTDDGFTRARFDDGFDLPSINAVPQMPAPMPTLTAPPPGEGREKMGKGQLLAGILGDMLSGALGKPATFAKHMMEQRQWDREDLREERKQSRTQFQNVPGEGLVAVNPADLTARTIVKSKTPGQSYAEAQGFLPGTPEYNMALSDYILKSSGPTAFGYKSNLQDDNQEAMADRLMRTLGVRREIAELMARTSTDNNQRNNATSAANNVRTTSTSAANNVRTNSTSVANSVRANETTRGGASYQGRSGKGANRYPDGTVIAGPGGQKMVRRNGQWVPQ